MIRQSELAGVHSVHFELAFLLNEIFERAEEGKCTGSGNKLC